ncbi:MAG: hypothetical protein ACFFCI_18585 [Promethearchaeota archaeon]
MSSIPFVSLRKKYIKIRAILGGGNVLAIICTVFLKEALIVSN